MRKLLLTTLFLCAACLSGRTQSLYFDRIDIKSGLSQNTVSEIIQDSRGFMWFGTKDGLNRYDGRHFKIFTHIPYDDGGLGSSSIRSLLEDDNNNIWVGTNAGLYIYSIEYDRFTPMPIRNSEGSPITRPILDLVKGPDGRIWISVEAAGVYCYSSGATEPECKYVSSKPIRTITADPVTGNIWFSWSADGLYYTEDEFRNINPFLLSDGKRVFPEDVISVIKISDYNKIYLGLEENGVVQLDRATGDVRKLNLTSGPLFVRQILQYSTDELWIGTESGLFIYNTRTKRHRHFAHFATDQYSLSDNAIHSLAKDRDGGIWIGTFFGGVNYLPKRIPDFNKYYNTGEPDALTGIRVGDICSDGAGGIWVGTEDAGLYHFDPQSGKFRFFEQSRDFSNIQALQMDGEDLWVSTFSKGLRVIDTRTGTVKKYEFVKTPGPRLFSNNIFALEKTSSGRIYIGTMHGLQFYNRDSDDFGYVPQINGGKMVNDIKEDSAGNLWVGTTSNGLYLQSSKDNSWSQFLHDPADTASIPGNNVLSVFEDTGGRIWITTDGSGFSRFNPDSKTFHTYTSRDGMPSEVAYQIVEDDAGKFWISTNRGLVQFDPERGKVLKIYTAEDGVLCDQFNYGSSYKDSSGRVYFGSIEGLVSFDPESLGGRTDKKLPPVFITDFFLLNDDIRVGGKGSPLKKDITFTDKVVLSYEQNDFIIELAALDYKDSPSLRYLLDGVETKWRKYEGSPVTYSSISPGDYTLRVQVGNSTEDARQLRIIIRPPWYRSILANIIYICIFAAALMGILLWFHRRTVLKRKEYIRKYARKKEKEVYDSKIEFFTNVTHEIRTPLTLIKGPLDNILTKGNPDPKIAKDLSIMSRNTDRLLVLVNQLLDFQKIEKENLSLKLTRENVADILEDVTARFSASMTQLQKDCKVRIENHGLYAMVDKEAFTKILSNMFSNAMKYSDKKIDVLLSAGNGMVRLSVSNDGDIIPLEKREDIFAPFYRGTNTNEKTGTGIGLYLARSLAELQNGSLKMGADSSVNEFILSVPLSGMREVPADGAADESEEDILVEDDMTEEAITGISEGDVILVVEDDEEMREFIKNQLAEKWEVLTARNGKEALEVLEKEENITLVVSDIMMPVMDGMQLCRAVKTDIRYSHIPFILLTAKTSLESKIEGMNVGADMYVEKPFTSAYLISVISNQLKTRQMLREAFLKNPLASLSDDAMGNADFLSSLQSVVRENFSNPEFTLDSVADMLHMSRSNLFRKIKGVLNMTPNDYLKMERLKYAASLLADNDYQVSEICYMAGFSTPSYFSKCFHKQFDIYPKEFRRNQQKEKNDKK